MHFSLVLIDHPEHGLVKAFDDVILPLSFALRRLGYEAEILRHRVNPASRNILFGTANDSALAGLDIPPDSIVVNLEQLAAENSVWNRPAYLEHLRQFAVWDYSRRNIEYLAARGLKAELLTLGYVPEMTRLSPNLSPDRDVLFYGLASPRRQAVLDELKTSGVTINQPQVGTFGRNRDMAIADSRLYLNIHHYLPATLEVVRLGYLWANRVPVVSERRADTEIYPELEGACAYADYEYLADTVRELLADGRKLKAQGEAGFEAFSGLSLEKSLENLVGRRVVYGQGHRFVAPQPQKLHIGSGRDFRNDSINIDINPICNPDLVLDLSGPLEAGKKYQTERFGEIELTPGGFEEITAFEVLEHVADLPRTMKNFLDLLKNGGRLSVSVPYDLSCGAWQDPTHVRAFNENSWLYYTEWAWYLGWREERFELDELSFILSSAGRLQVTRGLTHQELSRQPGTVDGLRVVLRKRPSTEEERRVYDRMFRSVYSAPTGRWEIEPDPVDCEPEEVRRAIFASPQAWREARRSLLGCNIRYYFCKMTAVFGFGRAQKELWKKKRAHWRNLISPGRY